MTVKKTTVAVAAAIILVLALALSACVPSRDACKTKYENAGYTTTPLSANSLELSGEDVDFIYCGVREASSDYIRVVAFKKKDKATEYAELMNVENTGEGAYITEQHGKVVLVGTQNALDIYNNKGGLVDDGAVNEEGGEETAE